MMIDRTPKFKKVKEWITKAGLPAVIVEVDNPYYRNKYYCGYVGVPSDHPLYRKEYTDTYNDIVIEELIEVHGGLTYSGDSLSVDTMYPSYWWFGFDTAHYFSDGISLERVIMHCEFLAKQLNDLNKKGDVENG